MQVHKTALRCREQVKALAAQALAYNRPPHGSLLIFPRQLAKGFFGFRHRFRVTLGHTIPPQILPVLTKNPDIPASPALFHRKSRRQLIHTSLPNNYANFSKVSTNFK